MNTQLASLIRFASRYRRWLAVVFAALATAFAVDAARPASTSGSSSVVAAARDLPGGARVRPGDLVRVPLPKAAIPGGAVRSEAQVTGRLLAGPVHKGEALTDVRVVSDSLLRAYGPGFVAAPVRIADAGSVRFLRPGDRVDVLASRTTATQDGPATRRRGDPGQSGIPPMARVIAPDVPVIAVPRGSPELSDEGALILLAASRGQAATLAHAAVDSRLSVIIVSGSGDE